MTATLSSPAAVTGFVPTIDLSAAWTGRATARAELAERIAQACATSGFFVITGHRVEVDLQDRMDRTTREFFALAPREKARCIAPTSARGFHAGGFVAASAGAKTPPDLCETFSASHLGEPGGADPVHFGADLASWNMPNVWPRRPAEFRATWLEYYAVMEQLAIELMRLFALGLGLPDSFFADKIDHHVSKLLANYYPASRRAQPGQQRKGAHTDWGSLTILHPDGTAGLQVQHQDGSWHAVDAPADSFVINLGDLMQVWTSGRWRSNVHRVVTRPDRRDEPRMTTAWFQHPNHDARIEPLPGIPRELGFTPVTAGDWLKAKAEAAANGIS